MLNQQAQSKTSATLRFKRFAGKSFSSFHSLHRVCTIGVLAGLTLTTLGTASAQGQKQAPRRSTPTEPEELEAVTVTSSRVSTPIAQAARQVTVITQREIASAPVRSLQDLLVYSAGVDVQQRGGHGVQADISLRGGSFDQNAVLLNGINLTNAETGHLSYDIPINLSDIERIEIVHGASGLIYGSAAFSGGINIITKADAHDRLYAQITYGQHGTHSVEGRTTLKTGESTHSISVGQKGSKGYTDNTDYRILNLYAQSHIRLNPHNRLHLQLGFNDKAYGANAFYAPTYAGQYEETDHLMASIKGELGTERLRIVPQIYWTGAHDHYLLIRNNPSAYENFHKTNHYGGNLSLSYRSAWGITTLAGELRRERIYSNRLGTPMPTADGHYTHSAQRTNMSLSLEHSLQLGEHLSASAGLLVNHNTQRQGLYEWLPSLSATYRPSHALSLSATWSRGVRVPTFIDLYYQGRVQTADPNLKAEHSQSLELTTRYRSALWDGYLTAFAHWGQDMIDWAKREASEPKYQSMNIGTLDTYGIELGGRLRLGELIPELGRGAQLRADYAYITQSHNSAGLISMYALRHLRHKLTARLDMELMPRLTSSWALRWQKRMGSYESGEETVMVGGVQTTRKLYSPYAGFVTLDTRLDYQLAPQLSLSLMLNNLTGTQYFDFSAVHQPGFWASVGLTYRLSR